MTRTNHDLISPGLLARIGGVLYLLIIAFGVMGELLIRGRILVPGDAAATAANLSAMQSLRRFGIAAEIMLLICGTMLTLVLFLLLRPVSASLALLAVFLNLVTIAIEAVGAVFLAGALLPLGSASYLESFSSDQLHASASLAARMHGYSFSVALIFFGFECVILGYLIFKATFLPRFLGVLMQIAGLCYVVNSFTFLLAPSFHGRLFPAILLPPFVAELSLSLWLLILGVNVERWRNRAGACIGAALPELA